MTELLTEVADGIATVTLNRPEARNALSPELLAAIRSAIADVDRRDDVAAVILTGADPAFCAGVDLKRLAGSGELSEATGFAGYVPPHDHPLIGAINGPAVTGGLELALCCDFLVASERAAFADTHARVGVMPGGGLTIRLPQLIGVDRARRMSLTGDFVDAATAYQWGLVTEVVPHDQLLPRARRLAASIASIPGGNISEIRAMYDTMSGLVGAAAWSRQRAWADEWMAGRFDRSRLAAEKDAIIERGSRQTSP